MGFARDENRNGRRTIFYVCCGRRARCTYIGIYRRSSQLGRKYVRTTHNAGPTVFIIIIVCFVCAGNYNLPINPNYYYIRRVRFRLNETSPSPPHGIIYMF